MTSPVPQFIDAGNELLAQVPARLDTGTIDVPGAGKLGVLTLRTTSATVTVFLGAEDLRSWGALLTSLAGQVGGIAMAAPGDLAVLGDLLKAPRRS